jgi:hypothetical protein
LGACAFSSLLGRGINNGALVAQPRFNPIKLKVRYPPTVSRNFSRSSGFRRTGLRDVDPAVGATRSPGELPEDPVLVATRDRLRGRETARLWHDGGNLPVEREHERGSYRCGSYGLRAKNPSPRGDTLSSIALPFATPASGQIERYAEEATKIA